MTAKPNKRSTLFSRLKLSPATVLAALALFVALGGSATATTVAITGKQVKNGTLTGADVKNESLTGKDVRNLTGKDIRRGTLRAAHFRAGELVAGAPGAQGPQGEAGPAGTFGTIVRRLGEPSIVTPGATVSPGASCLPGEPAIAGGFRSRGDLTSVQVLDNALLPGANAWLVLVRHNGANLQPFTVTTHVVCAS
jgi:hypothetical protein